jgi:KDO2-lipid IV(A) lauroyltransferase
MSEGKTLLGFFADQHGGDKGLILPFFGQECSTNPAPAVFALRYHCRLFTACCFRVAPGKWHVEVGEEIPTMTEGHPRSTESMMLEVNRAFEGFVRRDPANWFWVHNRWKYSRRKADAKKP